MSRGAWSVEAASVTSRCLSESVYCPRAKIRVTNLCSSLYPVDEIAVVFNGDVIVTDI